MGRDGDLVDSKIYTDKKEERLVWELREAGLGATARIPNRPDNWEGWEDSAVPPEKVGPYLRDLRKLLQKYGYQCSLYGHFGQGCIHTRINFELKTRRGRGAVSRVQGRGGRPRALLRRVALGRTRRRPGAR